MNKHTVPMLVVLLVVLAGGSLLTGCCKCASVKNPASDTSEQKDAEETEKPAEETPVSEATSTATIEIADSDWRNAFNTAKELVKKGEIKQASYFFTNAIGKNPGNMAIIMGYQDAIQKYIDKTKDTEAKYSALIALETFLQGQITSVPTDRLNDLIANLKKIENQRAALEAAAETAGASEMEESQASPLDELKAALKLQSGYVQKSLDAGYLDIASYQLQECEQIMRGLVALQPQLDKAGQKAVADCYENLKKLADSVVDKKAELVWNKYLESHKLYREKAAQVGKNSVTQSTTNQQPPKETAEAKDLTLTELIVAVGVVMMNTTSAEETPRGPAYKNNKPAKGFRQEQLDLVQAQKAELQRIMPQLSAKFLGTITDTPDKNTACAKMQELQNALEYVVKHQQLAYNDWALYKIKQCLDEAKEGVGVFANGAEGRATIDKALVTHLGPIDQRFLTSEVARCYQEVQNKYLADNQLNPAKKKKDFDEPGTKLHALKGMYETPKVQLFQF